MSARRVPPPVAEQRPGGAGRTLWAWLAIDRAILVEFVLLGAIGVAAVLAGAYALGWWW